jgi:hypothetical protein
MAGANLDAPATKSVTVNYGTAVDGADYSATSGAVTVSPGRSQSRFRTP